MSIELWTWNTPNGRKISVALEEMGLPYTVHPVNISKGEQFNPEFLAFSPNNRIPAIRDTAAPDGKPITVFESGAILIYLGQKTGKFWPADFRAQVPVLEWLMWQMGGFGPMPGQVHHFLQVENEADRRYGLERYSKETKRLYGVLDRRLAGRDFVADAVSIALRSRIAASVRSSKAFAGSCAICSLPSAMASVPRKADGGTKRRQKSVQATAADFTGCTMTAVRHGNVIAP